MPEPDREFQQRLLATFRGEAEEHVRAISRGLIDLENTPGVEERAPIVEKIFREAHSLKGAARAVNLKKIETICQSMEGVLARAKRREIALTADALDMLHGAMDEVEHLLLSTRGEPIQGGTLRSADLLGRLEATSRGSAAVEQSGQPEVETTLLRPETEKNVAEETVRVPVEQLDRLLLQVQELVPLSMGAAHRAAELRELVRDESQWKREWAKVQFVARSLRQTIDREESAPDRRGLQAQRLLDFLEWNEEFCGRFGTRLNVLSRFGGA